MCAWARNGTPNTLSGTADACSITDLTAKKFNQFLFHKLNSGNANNVSYCNADTSSVYATRYSQNGGTDATLTSRANLETNFVNDEEFFVYYCCSISGEEKLFINFVVHHVAAGATTAPQRVEFASKYVPSPDADITEMDFTNTDTGDFAAGTQSSALGGDVTEEAILGNNVQSGSRFEATDTRKIYYGALPSVTFEDNFDENTSWTQAGSPNTEIVHDYTTDNRIEFTNQRDSFLYKSMGITLSDTFVIQFTHSLTSNPTVGSRYMLFEVTAGTSEPRLSTQDALGVIVGGASQNLYQLAYKDGSGGWTQSASTEDISQGETKYLRLIRDGTNWTIEVYINSDYSDTPYSFTTTIPSTVTGLSYAMFGGDSGEVNSWT